MTSGCRIPVAAFCLVVALLLPAGVGAHVMATGLAVVTVNAREISYRLTVVPSELPEAASQLLSRAMAGSRPDAERIAEAMRRAVNAVPRLADRAQNRIRCTGTWNRRARLLPRRTAEAPGDAGGERAAKRAQ